MYANRAGKQLPLTVSQDVSPPDLSAAKEHEFHRESLEVGGREWQFIAQINPAWATRQRSNLPGLILGGGLTAKFLLSLLVNSLLIRNRQIERQVDQRTRELQHTEGLLKEDIERRIAVEQSLHESKALLEGILQNCPGEIFVKDLEGRYLIFNTQYQDSLEKSSDEIRGKTDHDLFEAKLADRFVDEDQRVISSGTALRYETEIEFHGHKRVDFVQKFPIPGPDGKPQALGEASSPISPTGRQRKNCAMTSNVNSKPANAWKVSGYWRAASLTISTTSSPPCSARLP